MSSPLITASSPEPSSTTGTSGACRANASAITAGVPAENHCGDETIGDLLDQIVDMGALEQTAGDPDHAVVRE